MNLHEQILSTQAYYEQKLNKADETYISKNQVLHEISNYYIEKETQIKIHDISSDENFIVLRTSGTSGEAKLNEHPLSFHDQVIQAGIKAVNSLGITGPNHTCLLAIAADRLGGAFYLGDMLNESLKNKIKNNFPKTKIYPLLYSANDTGPIGYPVLNYENTYCLFDNIVLEVSTNEINYYFEGSGDLYVTVLMRASPKLIRWKIGDKGKLWRDEKGNRYVNLYGRSNGSMKFKLDKSGSSFIVEQEQIMKWIRNCLDFDIQENTIQFCVDSRTEKATLILFLCDELMSFNLNYFQKRFLEFCPKSWNGRLGVRVCPRIEFMKSKAGKVPFFIHLKS